MFCSITFLTLPPSLTPGKTPRTLMFAAVHNHSSHCPACPPVPSPPASHCISRAKSSLVSIASYSHLSELLAMVIICMSGHFFVLKIKAFLILLPFHGYHRIQVRRPDNASFVACHHRQLTARTPPPSRAIRRQCAADQHQYPHEFDAVSRAPCSAA